MDIWSSLLIYKRILLHNLVAQCQLENFLKSHKLFQQDKVSNQRLQFCISLANKYLLDMV